MSALQQGRHAVQEDSAISAVPRTDLPAPFRCVHSFTGVGATWVQASGELDVATARQLELALHDAQLRSPLVVLDVNDLSFTDSAGVHVIVDASLRARLEGRRLMVAFAPAHVTAAFALTGTSDIVEILQLGTGAEQSLQVVQEQQ
ncbi:MAG: hypothetical protein QOC92_4475 [Acidimicrobiaceae bacterium]|jgi:anti-anti-sigma factor